MKEYKINKELKRSKSYQKTAKELGMAYKELGGNRVWTSTKFSKIGNKSFVEQFVVIQYF